MFSSTLTTIKNRTSLILSIIGGLMIISAGTSDAIGVLDELLIDLRELFGPAFVLTFAIITGILAILTVFGGILVIIGGLILTTRRVEVGRIVLLIAVIVSIGGLTMSLIQAILVGNLAIEMRLQLAQSIGWIGAILSTMARVVSEQAPLIERAAT